MRTAKTRRPEIRLHGTALEAMRNHPTVLAVSGGGDSMALLGILMRLLRARRITGPLMAAHINHQQRQPFADNAEALVANYCSANGIPCRTVRFDRLVGRTQAPAGESVEAWLAFHRHRWLADAARDFHADSVIATGHQADDHVESLLLGLLRGVGVLGLEFPVCKAWYGVQVVAPLASCRRDDLRLWLDRRSIPYLDDPMNEAGQCERSTVRDLLHALGEKTGRDFIGPMTRSAESIRQAGGFLRERAIAAAKDCTNQAGGLNVRTWRGLPEILQPVALHEWARSSGKTLSGRHGHELARWLRSSPLREGRFDMPDGQAFIVQNGVLIFDDPRIQDLSMPPRG